VFAAARVVRRFGSEVLAVYSSGGATGVLLCRLVEREDIANHTIPIAEETREDFFIFESDSCKKYPLCNARTDFLRF
jgi:6-phosphofructokinase 2